MAQSAALLEWNEDFRLGIPEVDQEHRTFFSLIRVIESGVFASEEHAARDALADLRRYAEEHFAHEEEFLAAVGYPDLPRHRAEHAEFLRDVTILEATPAVPLSVAVLMARAWIAQHILGTDRRYSRWLDESEEPRRTGYPTSA